MNSPVIDTSALDDESGVIPDESLWDKGCEEIPKANDFKFGVNFMNQLITLSKLDHYYGTTIGDSVIDESIAEDSSKDLKNAPGDYKLKGKPAKSKKTVKKAQLNADLSLNEENTENSKAGSGQKNQNRSRHSSVSPFTQEVNSKQRIKSGNQGKKLSKNSKIGSGKFDKNISTRATNNTNSENDENFSSIGREGIRMSNEKFSNKRSSKRGSSVLKKQQKMLRESSLDKSKIKGVTKVKRQNDLEEEKIDEEIQESYGSRFDRSKPVSNKLTPNKKDLSHSPIDPKVTKIHNKTETLLGQNNMKQKIDPMQRTQNTADGISFEDSLVTGTKIDIPKKNKNLQKKYQDVNSKKPKIDEIQKKYDNAGKKPKKKITRGYSYQEHEKIVRNKFGDENYKKAQKKHSNNNLDQVGVNASKITAKKRDMTKAIKGNEAVTQKIKYESKRKIEDEQTDEKLRTQTFRFTNQFQSEDGEPGCYNDNDEDAIYDEFIEEEIDTESHHSPPKNVRKMELVRDSGPQEIPSDTNPFVKRHATLDDVSKNTGTPVSKPPKVPPRVNMKNVFKSPVNEIFKTSKQKKNDDISVVENRNSDPAKPISSAFQNTNKEENKFSDAGILLYDVSNEEETHAKDSQGYHKSITELTMQKMRSDYTKDTLMKRPYSPPFINDNSFN